MRLPEVADQAGPGGADRNPLGSQAPTDHQEPPTAHGPSGTAPARGRVVCAYCKAILGSCATEGDSHGICRDCYPRARADAGLPPKPFPEPETAQEWAEGALIHHGAKGCDPCALEAERIK